MPSLIVTHDDVRPDGRLVSVASGHTVYGVHLDTVVETVRRRGFEPDIDAPDGTIMVSLGEVSPAEAHAIRNELHTSIGGVV